MLSAIIILYISKATRHLLEGFAFIGGLWGLYYLCRYLYRKIRDRRLRSIAQKFGMISEKISLAPYKEMSAFKAGKINTVLSNYWCFKDNELFGFLDISASTYHKADVQTESGSRTNYATRTLFLSVLNAEAPPEFYEKAKSNSDLKEIMEKINSKLSEHYLCQCSYQVQGKYLVVYSLYARVPMWRMVWFTETSLEVVKLLNDVVTRLG